MFSKWPIRKLQGTVSDSTQAAPRLGHCLLEFGDLWTDTARLLALSDDTKGDFLELTLGAAAVLLDGKMHLLSQPLQRCLHGARLVIKDLARTCEEIWLLKQQCAPLPRRTRNGCEVVLSTVCGVTVNFLVGGAMTRGPAL